MGLKLQPCFFSPMLDVKGFVIPFGKCALSWTLLYTFSTKGSNANKGWSTVNYCQTSAFDGAFSNKSFFIIINS